MISIIIVNFNSGDYLSRCLNSIEKYAGEDIEVVVVDNKSTDDSIDRCMHYFELNKYVLVRLDENLGFAKANNIGVEKASGDMFHFLNPDTELRQGMSDDYATCRKQPDNIYVNKLQNPDGSFVESINVIPTLGNYFRKVFHFGSVGLWYTGATVIMSRSTFELIGGWNESFFMYSEDLDLFYKAFLNKVSTVFLPSVITHVGGGSSSKVWNSFERELKVQRSFKNFFVVNNIKWQYPFILFFIFIRVLLINPRNAMFCLRVWARLNFNKGE